jgi:hypothetical protein
MLRRGDREEKVVGRPIVVTNYPCNYGVDGVIAPAGRAIATLWARAKFIACEMGDEPSSLELG